MCIKQDIYPVLQEKASVSNGEEGEWNLEFLSQTSCLGGDFVIDNHKMTTPKIYKSAKKTQIGYFCWSLQIILTLESFQHVITKSRRCCYERKDTENV